MIISVLFAVAKKKRKKINILHVLSRKKSKLWSNHALEGYTTIKMNESEPCDLKQAQNIKLNKNSKLQKIYKLSSISTKLKTALELSCSWVHVCVTCYKGTNEKNKKHLGWDRKMRRKMIQEGSLSTGFRGVGVDYISGSSSWYS
jgi:hypothetical protein